MKRGKMLALKAAFLKWCSHCHMLHSVPSLSPMTRVHPSHVHSALTYHTQHQCAEGAQGSLKKIHKKQLPSYWLTVRAICSRWQLECLSLFNITAWVCSVWQLECFRLFNTTAWVLISVQHDNLNAFSLFSVTTWVLMPVQHHSLVQYHSLTHQLQDCTPS